MASKGGYNPKLAELHALRRAQTEVKILEAIAASPGSTIPQIAQSVQLDPNYIRGVLRRYLADGLVWREQGKNRHRPGRYYLA